MKKRPDRTVISPSGRYQLDIVTKETSPDCWNCTVGTVREGGRVIAIVERNYFSFPHLFIEGHANGHDYLVCGEHYQSQTVIELDTGLRKDAPRTPTSFCWASYHYDPRFQILVVEGCFWAAPYESQFFDFSDPMSGWPEIELQPPNSIDLGGRSPEISEDGTITCFETNDDFEDEPAESSVPVLLPYDACQIVVAWTKYRREGMTLILVDNWLHPKEKARREDEEAWRLRYAESKRKGQEA